MNTSAAVVSAVLVGAGSVGVPTLIRRVPEPLPDVDSDPEAPPATPTKVPYADIAATPHLWLWSVLTGAVAGAVMGGALGWDWALLVVLPLVPVGLALAVIDWRTRLLPTRLIAPAYALVIACALLAAALSRSWAPVEHAALGWVIAGVLFWVLWWIYPSGMGYGDVRLSGVLGIALGFVGFAELAFGIWMGFVLGGVIGLVLMVVRRSKDRRYPFGPFMLAGAVIGVAWGRAVLGV